MAGSSQTDLPSVTDPRTWESTHRILSPIRPHGLEDPASDLPQAARGILAILVEQLRSLDERVAVLDREIARHAKENAVARRLMTIPGIGAVTAAALTALAPPAETFRRGRDFAAWLG